MLSDSFKCLIASSIVSADDTSNCTCWKGSSVMDFWNDDDCLGIVTTDLNSPPKIIFSGVGSISILVVVLFFFLFTWFHSPSSASASFLILLIVDLTLNLNLAVASASWSCAYTCIKESIWGVFNCLIAPKNSSLSPSR